MGMHLNQSEKIAQRLKSALIDIFSTAEEQGLTQAQIEARVAILFLTLPSGTPRYLIEQMSGFWGGLQHAILNDKIEKGFLFDGKFYSSHPGSRHDSVDVLHQFGPREALRNPAAYWIKTGRRFC